MNILPGVLAVCLAGATFASASASAAAASTSNGADITVHPVPGAPPQTEPAHATGPVSPPTTNLSAGPLRGPLEGPLAASAAACAPIRHVAHRTRRIVHHAHRSYAVAYAPPPPYAYRPIYARPLVAYYRVYPAPFYPVVVGPPLYRPYRAYYPGPRW